MAIEYSKDEQNIVTLTLDMPGRSANVINAEFTQALQSALDRLEKEEPLAGAIITSAKSTFVAGADLEFLLALEDPAAAFNMAEGLKALFRRIEKLGKPVVAALNGTALGGGLEIALSCHHRIVLDSPKTKIGFPEVTLGLLPGAGGVTRLVRMLGLQAAFPYLVEGKELRPAGAKSAGIVNDVAADRGEMMEKARAWIAANPKAKAPWDERDFKIPGGTPTRPDVAQMLAIAPAMLRKKTYRNYPAPEAIMSAAVEGAMVDFDTACRIESRYFAGLAVSNIAKNMIGTFWFQLNDIKGGKSRPAGIGRIDTKKVGVLGAGMMGHGIAYVSAMAGMEVVLKDVTIEQAEAGKAAIEKLLAKRVSRGRMAKEEKDAILAAIKPTASAEDLQGCDLVIEAVFEDRGLKAKVTKEAEAQIAADAVFGSNTSTLPITGLAEPSSRPENFIGIHFFSPVDKMPLVEIIVGKKTCDTALAKAFDYVLKIRKTPIVVNDGRGFYTSRVFSTYVSEGLALLGEGQHPRAIESAGMQAGMPVGPLAVSDEISLALMWHIREQTRKDLEAEGKELPAHPGFKVVEAMVNEHKRLGKAAGAGFYEYPSDGKKFLWPELGTLFPPKGVELPQSEMIDRMMFAQCIETARCYEEGILTSVADANIGSVFGWGFAPFKGGSLQFINDYGVRDFVHRATELAGKYGDRFSPPSLLVKMADKGETF
ncbi:MAG: 3-hydroxyacyl-CoA dehydrogenase / enoyl-CoA hydratase / 3-hydroxybutyryl-CoA epimerase [Candidatus Hydrogenedentes bacterium]|nr:3-hydroxyacyl-CoA dehydrogenase / enoyl-CoA hydratase / 3-hydroxybutyryl-CoA epimerase [Candidatus Hydrogenedentota bacterium]